MNELFIAARALLDGEERRELGFLVERGRFTKIGDAKTLMLEAAHRGTPTRRFPEDRLLVPGFINGHSHAYQVLLRGWADDWSFDKWRSDALYRVVPQLTPDDIYWVFVFAFSEMLAAGITTVVEFFYLNGAGNDHAEAAIRAARETGIRLVFARTWMDAAYAPDAYRETIDEARSRSEALLDRHPDINFCVAPHSLHAASPAMIEAAAAFAAEYDCMLHVHVAEAAYEGEATLREHGATPIRFLDRLGALNERCVAVHAIYIDDEEKELLAERGARVIHNPMTNQYLGDGICDISSLRALGVPLGLGTDADVKPSAIDEMRAASLLQKIARSDGAAFGARAAFDMATASGARALRIDAGRLEEGAFADFVVLDARAIDPWAPAVNALVYRGEDAWVQGAFVGGRRVGGREPSAAASAARERLRGIAERLVP
ncbi:MAG: amidohydrolase family protein [Candidatus Eremiobacteraeota bacterium]|nr:amidohydrolase family protein [Candidatus Eremiobacteraeota bacterium]NNM91928.1 amidohydrolase family protein [Candidatus Eremiobacteraeota bacterium]